MRTNRLNEVRRGECGLAAVFTFCAAAFIFSAPTVSAAVLDLDQIPGRDQVLHRMGNLADIKPGVTALESGDYVTAAKLARTYIGRNPNDAKPHLLLVLAWYGQKDDGRIHRYLGEVDAQLPALGASLRETVAGLYLRDGRLYRAGVQLEAIPAPRRTDQSEFLAAVVAGRQGDVEGALGRIDKLAVKVPDSVPLAINQSRLALMSSDYAAAAAAAERALKASPNLDAAQLLLGTARMQQGRHADARKAFEAILARNAGYGPAALNIGLIDLADGRHADASTAFRTARSLGNGDARPYYGEATAALAAKDLAGARGASAGARKQSPQDPIAGLVDVLVRGSEAGDPSAATARTAAAQFFPDLLRKPVPASIAAELADPAAARRLAVANVLAHTWSGAAAVKWLDDEKATGGGPLFAMTRARALASAGQWAESARVLDALRKDPSAAGLVGPWAQAAGVAAAQKKGPDAVANLREAIKRAPELPSLRATLGDLLNKLGQPDNAVPEYREALRLAPRDPRLLNQLAASLALIGTQSGLQEALQLVDVALQQKPHYLTRAQLLDTRADLIYRLDRKPEALAAYRELSGTVGGMQGPEPWHRFGELALAAGDKSVAETAFEKALDYGRPYPKRNAAIEQVAALSTPRGP